MAKSAARRPSPAERERQAEDFAEYPKVFYKKVPESRRWPQGYETRRVEDEAQEAALDKKVWKATVTELDAPAEAPAEKKK